MSNQYDWWKKPRKISVVVDNPSWILPYAEAFVDDLNKQGDRAALCRSHDDIMEGGVAFYLGCTHITPQDILEKNRVNLVVHESNLPEGKGFAPLTWQILEGKDEVVVSLIEAVDDVDAGNIILQETLSFQGHELCDEIRDQQGKITIKLCERYLDAVTPEPGRPQEGESSFYSRRTPKDSELDPEMSIKEQFNLLRVADSERYPAFFHLRGHKYIIRIEKEHGNQ